MSRLNKSKILIFVLNNLIWVLLLLTIVIFQMLTPRFLSQRNLLNILEHASVLGIMVIGQSIALITGNFDLSAESTLGLTALIGAWLVTAAGSPSNGSGLELNPIVTILIMLVIGAGIGILNGFLITRLKMNNFIVTLALMIILRGIVMVINQGVTISKINPAFTWLGHDKFLGIPISIILMLSFFAVFNLIMRSTQFGRDLYAVGGNRDAAQASGIDTAKRIRQIYVIGGLIAAFSGWIFVGRLGSAVASMGQGMIFEIQAAAVIGGISLFGGRGSMIGALGGVLLLSSFDSGLALMRVSAFWIDTVRGAIILLAMIVDARKVTFLRRQASSAVTTHAILKQP